jgi:hypothetical protein
MHVHLQEEFCKRFSVQAMKERGTDLNVNFTFLTKGQMAESPHNMSQSFGRSS